MKPSKTTYFVSEIKPTEKNLPTQYHGRATITHQQKRVSKENKRNNNNFEKHLKANIPKTSLKQDPTIYSS